MPTIAHKHSWLPGRARPRLAIWLVGAVLVAAVAFTLALSAGGSGGAASDRTVDPAQPASQTELQGPTPCCGHRP